MFRMSLERTNTIEDSCENCPCCKHFYNLCFFITYYFYIIYLLKSINVDSSIPCCFSYFMLSADFFRKRVGVSGDIVSQLHST